MKFLLCVCFLALLRNSILESPRATTRQGQLRGKYFVTRNGRKVLGFLGIPFAKPPIGDLRFKRPQPPESWTGIRDATRDAEPCVQNNLFAYRTRNVTFGSEDCLYLNVYTPRIVSYVTFPVMVYIHGGGFTSGSSTSQLYGPEYLLDKDIVLVVINYRLGPLGFLSTEDSVLPGNYGLKDQAQALIWIRNHIRAFSGNHEAVTICGSDAGAASVHLHLMSTMSAGFFHRGISQSGSGLCSWAMHPPGSNRKTAHKVAREFGCPTNGSEELGNCLRKIPPYNITSLIYKYLKFDLDPTVIFPPSVETYDVDEFIFLDPWLGSTYMPWLSGVVSQEGSMKVASLIRGGEEGKARLAKLNAEYETLMPETILVDKHAKDPINISKSVKEYYFGKDPISKAKLPELINMYSDSWFTYCMSEAGLRHRGPHYQYYLSYKGNKSLAFLYGNTEDDLGVCHTDELIYLFPLNAYFPNRTDTEEDLEFSHRMIEMWTNFVIYRNPNPTDTEPFIKWEPVTYFQEYINITNNGYQMIEYFYKELDKQDFWRHLPFREKPKAVRPI